MNKPMSLMISLSFMVMLLTLISRQQHILTTFMCLEGLMLFMIYYIPVMMNSQSMNTYSLIIIIMLTVSVSSASISLALLVMSSRKEGNDSTMLTSTYMC